MMEDPAIYASVRLAVGHRAAEQQGPLLGDRHHFFGGLSFALVELKRPQLGELLEARHCRRVPGKPRALIVFAGELSAFAGEDQANFARRLAPVGIRIKTVGDPIF
ncbi:hypothetical protein ACVWZK_006407 [Bradyrhizobium sp. GM0.4]